MHAPPRRVTIVIPCWNRFALTERCLASLARHTDLTHVDVVAVDNGSTDETAAGLAALPWVRVVRHEENLGFVRGCNAGIAAADPASDVVLLNNDVIVTRDGWIASLAATAHADPDVGIVGCRLVLPDGRLLHAGTFILPDTLWGQQIGSLEKEVNQYAADRTVQGIVFACAYIRREALAAIGGLSLAYTSYFEDTDYCLRAAEAGFRTVCCGSLTLVHDEHGSTRDTPGAFDEIFTTSRETFRELWHDKLEARYTHDLAWQSIMNAPTGYAMSCREILRALDGVDVRARYAYVYGKGTPHAVDEPPNADDYLLQVIAGRPLGDRPPLSVVYGQGDVFRQNRGAVKVGYTMLEVDGFPAEWVRQANRMDEVWVPSVFNREGMLRSGVERPIHVVPLGVDVDHFHPAIAAYPNPRGEFVFLASFEWGERKAPELTLRAFNDTFRHDEPVVLVCKVINRDPSINFRKQVAALRLRANGGRIAFIYNREFPYHQIGALYRSADCFVTAGRGEGWNMPLMEAMACGLPAIAVDWGGQREFIDDDVAYLLRIRGTVPAVAKCPYYEGFSWADPDTDHLRTLMRHVVEHRAEAAAKGRRAAEAMRTRWTWRHAALRIKDRVAALS